MCHNTNHVFEKELDLAKKYFASFQDLSAMSWRISHNKLTEEDKEFLEKIRKDASTVQWGE